MKPINDFVKKFNTTISLDEKLIVRKQNRYYVLNENLRRLIAKEFFCAGTYLGKERGRVFFPSFNLLAIIAEKKANKVTVDEKTEWLFICGRDVFKQGILDIKGSKKRGTHTLILDQHGECLGFGKILKNPDEKQAKNQPTIRNIADIGDYLRRERPQTTRPSQRSNIPNRTV